MSLTDSCSDTPHTPGGDGVCLRPSMSEEPCTPSLFLNLVLSNMVITTGLRANLLYRAVAENPFRHRCRVHVKRFGYNVSSSGREVEWLGIMRQNAVRIVASISLLLFPSRLLLLSSPFIVARGLELGPIDLSGTQFDLEELKAAHVRMCMTWKSGLAMR